MTAEGVAAGEAAVVIEDTLVDHLAELGTGKAASSASDERADECAEQTAGQHAGWSGDDTDGHAELGAGQTTGGAAYAAADGTDYTAGLACEIAGFDALGAAIGASVSHGFPLGMDRVERGFIDTYLATCRATA